MIKLTNILSEMKVNKPPMSKKRIIDFLREYPYIFRYLPDYSSVEELTSDLGYSSVEELLKYDFGMDKEGDAERVKTISNYIHHYYKVFKMGEVYASIEQPHDMPIELLNVSYKNIILDPADDRDVFLLCY